MEQDLNTKLFAAVDQAPDAASFEEVLGLCCPSSSASSHMANVINSTFLLECTSSREEMESASVPNLATTPNSTTSASFRASSGTIPFFTGKAENRDRAATKDASIEGDVAPQTVKSGWSLLHEAVETNRVDILSLLLSRGANPNTVDLRGFSPLHLAALHNRKEALMLLIGAGADVTIKSKSRLTPHHLAAYNNHSFCLKELIKKKEGMLDVACGAGWTPLHYAAYNGSVNVSVFLLANGASVDSLDSNSSSALHKAVARGHVAFVRLLLKYGASVSLSNNARETALHIACLLDHQEIFDLLFEKQSTSLHTLTKDERSCMHYASSMGKLNYIQTLSSKGGKLLLSLKDKNGMNALHLLVMNMKEIRDEKEEMNMSTSLSSCSPTCSRQKKKASPEKAKQKRGKKKNNRGMKIPLKSQSPRGKTHDQVRNAEVLRRAEREEAPKAKRKEEQIVSKLNLQQNERNQKENEEKLKCFDFLLKEGMEPLERDNRGQTVLHFAARIGNKEVFQHVAETGVNISGQINARDANGNTCVHLAVKHWRGCLLNYLLATFLGAIQLNVKNNEGFTPFLLAVHGGNTHIVQLLFEWGQVIDNRMEELLEAKNGHQKGFLHLAAENNHVESLSYMLEALGKERIASMLEEEDENNDTPFNLAAKHGALAAMALLLSVKKETDPASVVGFISHRGHHGRAPIHNVVDCLDTKNRHRCKHGFWLLLEEGAQINDPDDMLHSPLHLATRRGHLDFMKGLLERGVDINGADHRGMRPLHMATMSGTSDCVNLLLANGASPNPTSTNGLLPLHWASLRGCANSVASLLNSDPSMELDAKDVNGLTALHFACVNGHTNCVSLLLARRADPNVSDNHGNTPLHKAISSVECVNVLLQHKANPNVSNAWGATPLHICCLGTSDPPEAGLEVFSQLIDAGADCMMKTALGNDVLHLLTRSCKVEYLRLLFSRKGLVDLCSTKASETALHRLVDGLCHTQQPREWNQQQEQDSEAKPSKHIDCDPLDEFSSYAAAGVCSDPAAIRATIELLLLHGIDLNAVDQQFGETALLRAMRVSRKHNTALVNSFVEILLEKGADVNLPDHQGRTALHVASMKGDSEIVLLLLKKGRPLTNVCDQWGNTPLSYALDGRHEDTASLLLEHNSRVDIQDGQGRDPLHFAALYGWEAFGRQLLSIGTEANIGTRCTHSGVTPLILAARGGHVAFVSLLLSKSVDLELATFDKGRTALHEACYHGHSDVVKALLSAHAKISAVDKWGQSPLHLAAVRGHAACVEELLTQGAAATSLSNNGNTPLHLATLFGKTATVRLLKGDSLLQVRDPKGNTALHLAVRKGFVDVSAVLFDGIREKDHLSETMYGEDGMGPLQSLIHERLYGGNGSPAYREATDKMLDFLLIRAGISLHSLDKKGRNILHTVAGMPAPPPPTSHASSETDYRYKSWMHLVEQLIAKGICRGGAVNVREKENGNAPLHECASKGNDLLLSILCKHGGNVLLRNTNGETPLHVACRTGNLQAVKLILAVKEGKEALPLLDLSCHSPLVSALLYRRHEIVRFLFSPESGISLDINAKDAQGRAAIHYAAGAGQLEAVKLLLELGADINAKEINTGTTALHIVSGAGYKDVVLLLLKSNADVNAQDKCARTPIKLAHHFKQQDVAQLLLQYDAASDFQSTLEVLKTALKSNDLGSVLSAVEESENASGSELAKRTTFGLPFVKK